jgi:hypothetical protein
MLVDAAPEVVEAAADHEHPFNARESFDERGGIIEVAAANGEATVGKIPQVLRSTADEDDVCGRDAFEQFLHDKAAELPRCSSDHDAHADLVLLVRGVQPTVRRPGRHMRLIIETGGAARWDSLGRLCFERRMPRRLGR